MSNDAQPTRPTVYPSAVDLWLPLLILMTPAAAVFFGVLLIRQGRASEAITLFLMGGGLLLVFGMFTIPCRYTILEDTLSIRCGIMFRQIPLAEIESLQSSASLRSAPALSVRRVLVKTKKRDYLISPKRREAFIKDLQQAIQAAS